MPRWSRSLVALLVALSATACSRARRTPKPAEPCTPDLASIERTILVPSCAGAGCHEGPSAPGGLDFARAGAALELVGVRAAAGSRVLISPGHPDGSYLFQKVALTEPAVGVRMPVSAPPLADTQLACLRTWIEQLPATPRR